MLAACIARACRLCPLRHTRDGYLASGKLKSVLGHCNDLGRREMVIHYPHREFVAPRIRAFVDFALDTLQHEVSLHVTPKDLQQYEA